MRASTEGIVIGGVAINEGWCGCCGKLFIKGPVGSVCVGEGNCEVRDACQALADVDVADGRLGWWWESACAVRPLLCEDDPLGVGVVGECVEKSVFKVGVYEVVVVEEVNPVVGSFRDGADFG